MRKASWNTFWRSKVLVLRLPDSKNYNFNTIEVKQVD